MKKNEPLLISAGTLPLTKATVSFVNIYFSRSLSLLDLPNETMP